MRQLVEESISPRNRDEQEIVGYRDVLNTIHESFEHIPLKSEIILQLYRDLLAYTDKTFGGKFKSTHNYISETHAEGSSFTRFSPLESFETPMAVDAICASNRQALENQVIDLLILVPIFICDFLCIHPFNDGNGRMSLLLTTLLLYQSGFTLGKYINLEQKIESTKDTYYDVLGKVSFRWHEGGNDYTPFIKYFLGIVLNCYRDLDTRLGSMDDKRTPYKNVRTTVENTLVIFPKFQILELCPSIGISSVEATLKRLKEEGFIIRQGSGWSTTYVRNPNNV